MAREYSLKANKRQTQFYGLDKPTLVSILQELGIHVTEGATKRECSEKILSYVQEKCPKACMVFS